MRALLAFLAFGLVATLPLPAMSAAVPGQGTWETTLLPRYYEGKVVAYYDTVLDITWLRDAGAGGLGRLAGPVRVS